MPPPPSLCHVLFFLRHMCFMKGCNTRGVSRVLVPSINLCSISMHCKCHDSKKGDQIWRHFDKFWWLRCCILYRVRWISWCKKCYRKLGQLIVTAVEFLQWNNSIACVMNAVEKEFHIWELSKSEKAFKLTQGSGCWRYSQVSVHWNLEAIGCLRSTLYFRDWKRYKPRTVRAIFAV